MSRPEMAPSAGEPKLESFEWFAKESSNLPVAQASVELRDGTKLKAGSIAELIEQLRDYNDNVERGS